MIIDLRAWADPPLLECDVCIVGAGAAGLAIGRALAGTRLSVVILEAGGADFESRSQALYEASVTGLPYAGHIEGRVRMLGGTTTRWGGQALPLTEGDFEQREWVPYSGWPITLATVAPYYRRAVEFLGLDDQDFGAGLAKSLNTTLPAFRPNTLHSHFSKWSPQPNMASRHASALGAAANVRVVLHSNVTHIQLGADDGVERVEARTLDGRQLSVAPTNLVLACGGLEVARLLLANRSQRPSGLGNEHDLVGRFLQDHPGCQIGTLTPVNDKLLQEQFNVFHRHGTRYTVRFALAPDIQRKERTNSASGTLMFVSDPASGFEAAKELYRGIRAGRLSRRAIGAAVRVVRDARHVTRAALRFAQGRTFAPNAIVRLMGSFEQPPDPESRVVLGKDTDELGVPRLDIRWQLNSSVLRTARVFARVAKEELEAQGAGDVTLAPWLENSASDWRTRLVDHYHHIGTARMHESVEQGVVDADCRVHSIKNLHIASSAVFPTGGHSNPTLTIIALAFRLADRLLAA